MDAACVALLRARSVEVLQGNHDYWASLGQRGTASDAREWLFRLPRVILGTS